MLQKHAIEKCIPFSGQFTRLEGKECLGDSIQYYTTLQAAKVACMNNIECGCIYDRKCDGDQWFTSKGSAVYSDTAKTGTQESCTWTKSTIAFYSHIRKLIFRNIQIMHKLYYFVNIL